MKHQCYLQTSQLCKTQDAISKYSSLLHGVLAGFKLVTEV